MSGLEHSKEGISRRIAKVLGLFTGLQMFTIICSIIKMKLVALWLHAAGVGLFGIFNFSIETLSTLTDLGLRQSAVREIARTQNNPSGLARKVALVRSWSGVAGMLGAVVMVSLSPLFSYWFFGDWQHWWMFAVLAGAMLLNSLVAGENAILQGSQMLRNVAKIGFASSTIGLIVSIPMFRWLGEESVAYSIVAYSLAALVCALIWRKKDIGKQQLNRQFLAEGKGFVTLGAFMAIAAFATSLSQLIFMAWLNRNASTSEVGFYQAGTTIVVRYVGLIFSAISMELYPRLSANSHSKRRLSLFVSHEISLLLLLLVPFILIFLLLRGVVVQVLYTQEFMVIIPFISWAIMGVVFRTASTCMAYTILARGDGKTYLLTESLDAAIGLGLNILMYSLFGVTGLGIAYLLWFFIYFIMTGMVYRHRYHLTLNLPAIKTLGIAIAVVAAAFAMIQLLPLWCCLPLFAAIIAFYIRPLLTLLKFRK